MIQCAYIHICTYICVHMYVYIYIYAMGAMQTGNIAAQLEPTFLASLGLASSLLVVVVLFCFFVQVGWWGGRFLVLRPYKNG